MTLVLLPAPSRAGILIRDPHTRTEVLCEYGDLGRLARLLLDAERRRRGGNE